MSNPQNETIYYSRFPAEALGTLGMAVNSKGLCLISFGCSNEKNYLNRLRHRFPEKKLIFDSDKTQPVQEQLREYLYGQRKEFEFSLDYESLGTPFQRKVLLVTLKIPFGQVVTYGDLAETIASPKAPQAVGNALGKNPIPIVIPCHRVVAKDGSMGGFTGGLKYKKILLRLEGVRMPFMGKQLGFKF